MVGCEPAPQTQELQYFPPSHSSPLSNLPLPQLANEGEQEKAGGLRGEVPVRQRQEAVQFAPPSHSSPRSSFLFPQRAKYSDK